MKGLPFRKATLNDRGGDLSKRWYIEFYAYHAEKKKQVRKRLYQINKIKVLEDRYEKARELMANIDELLEEGRHFGARRKNQLFHAIESSEMAPAILDAVKIKLTEIKTGQSRASYEGDIRQLLEFIEKKGMKTLPIGSFDRAAARGFMDYLQLSFNYSNVTINNKKARLSGVFHQLQERGFIQENPFRAIKKLKERVTKRNIALTKRDEKKVIEALKKEGGVL